MKQILMILNGSAYGSDETFNALRLAVALAHHDDAQLSVFLLGDAVTCAIGGQKTPDGFYNLDRMLRSIIGRGGAVACCGTCMETRGLTADDLIEETTRSTMQELAEWTIHADQVLTF
jgi:uncharacterized protein involved in oxidation of intracellular sulfur